MTPNRHTRNASLCLPSLWLWTAVPKGVRTTPILSIATTLRTPKGQCRHLRIMLMWVAGALEVPALSQQFFKKCQHARSILLNPAGDVYCQDRYLPVGQFLVTEVPKPAVVRLVCRVEPPELLPTQEQTTIKHKGYNDVPPVDRFLAQGTPCYLLLLINTAVASNAAMTTTGATTTTGLRPLSGSGDGLDAGVSMVDGPGTRPG